MKNFMMAFVSVVFMIALAYGQTGQSGKDVFLKAKCDMCHSIAKENIITKSQKPKALENIKETSEELNKFLQKEIKLHDVQHPIKLKADSVETKILIDWLKTI